MEDRIEFEAVRGLAQRLTLAPYTHPPLTLTLLHKSPSYPTLAFLHSPSYIHPLTLHSPSHPTLTLLLHSPSYRHSPSYTRPLTLALLHSPSYPSHPLTLHSPSSLTHTLLHSPSYTSHPLTLHSPSSYTHPLTLVTLLPYLHAGSRSLRTLRLTIDHHLLDLRPPVLY